MDMVPDYNDEGDMPAKYANATFPEPTVDNINAGKAIFVANCAFCHGYSGGGDGPDAAGLLPGAAELHRDIDLRRLGARRLLLAHQRLDSDARDAAVAHVVHARADPLGRRLRQEHADLPEPRERAGRPGDPQEGRVAQDACRTPSIMRGRQVYLQRCWMCHGDAGQGEGPDGQHLAPLPANFTEPDLKKFPDSEWFWKVSYGIGNAAMPQWHLLLSEEDRWAAIKYVKAMFVNPSEPTT